MVTAIEASRSLERSTGGKGSVDSTDYSDRLTVHPDIRQGEIDQAALLIVGGATDANEELLDDQLAAARKNGNATACQKLKVDGALTPKKRRDARRTAGSSSRPRLVSRNSGGPLRSNESAPPDRPVVTRL